MNETKNTPYLDNGPHQSCLIPAQVIPLPVHGAGLRAQRTKPTQNPPRNGLIIHQARARTRRVRNESPSIITPTSCTVKKK